MKAKKKENEAIHECYRRLYNNSIPNADFDQLVENAEINEHGLKEIDFNSYEIEKEIFEDILEDIIDEYKIKPKYRAEAFKITMRLGATPRFKNNISEK